MIRADWVKQLYDSGVVRYIARSRCFEPELLDDYVSEIYLELLTTERDFATYRDLLYFAVAVTQRYMTLNGRSRKLRKMFTDEELTDESGQTKYKINGKAITDTGDE